MARKNLTPTKTELAQFRAMSDLGLTSNAIGLKTSRDPKTVKKYLKSDVYTDPEIAAMVDIIKEGEIKDLYLLGAKARQRLHDLVDAGDTKVIETIALMDRSFQQRRLLEGQSTENHALVQADIEAIRKMEDKQSKWDVIDIDSDD